MYTGVDRFGRRGAVHGRVRGALVRALLLRRRVPELRGCLFHVFMNPPRFSASVNSYVAHSNKAPIAGRERERERKSFFSVATDLSDCAVPRDARLFFSCRGQKSRAQLQRAGHRRGRVFVGARHRPASQRRECSRFLLLQSVSSQGSDSRRFSRSQNRREIAQGASFQLSIRVSRPPFKIQRNNNNNRGAGQGGGALSQAFALATRLTEECSGEP